MAKGALTLGISNLLLVLTLLALRTACSQELAMTAVVQPIAFVQQEPQQRPRRQLTSNNDTSTTTCFDVQPPGGRSCPLLKSWGWCGNPDMRAHGYCAVECGACATFAGTVAHKAPRKPPDRVAQPLSVPAPPGKPQPPTQQQAAQRQAARPTPKPTQRQTPKPTAPAIAAASKTAASPTRAPTKAPTAAPTPAPSATYFTYSDLVKSITDTHNAVRAKHADTGPLKWNVTMAASAQAYAEKCTFKHSGAPGQGENLYEAFYYPNTAHPLVNGWLSAVDAWYKEIATYNYTKPGFTSGTGHFTAVVWKATTDLGCGAANCKDAAYPTLDATIFVCRYWTQGNVATAAYFSANVLPLRPGLG